MFSILQFLATACKDGSIKSDDIEGIEIASQCISEAFSVDLEDAQDQKNFDIAPETLSNLLQSHFVRALLSPGFGRRN